MPRPRPIDELALNFANELANRDWQAAADALVDVHTVDPTMAAELLRFAFTAVAAEGQHRGRNTAAEEVAALGGGVHRPGAGFDARRDGGAF